MWTSLFFETSNSCYQSNKYHLLSRQLADAPFLSHDVLVVPACRVGLPAVLEVVGQHRVPAVLLVLVHLALERQRAVALQLLQRRVVEGHQVLLAAGQQLLLFVGIVLGLWATAGDV